MRSAMITSPFIGIFAIIVVLARATALETPAAWFSPEISLQFYEVTLVTASLLALGIVSVAVSRAGRLDTAIRELDLEIASIRQSIRDPVATEDPEPGRLRSVGPDGRIEVIEVRSQQTGKLAHDSLIDLSTVVEPDVTYSRQVLWRELQEQRGHLVSLKDQVWPLVIGPISLAILFVGISGAMLPGVRGFLESNFRLNTALILLIGYSWWLLVTWTVFTLAMLPSETLDRALPRTRVHSRYG